MKIRPAAAKSAVNLALAPPFLHVLPGSASASKLGMRTTLNLDDDLLSQAQRLSGINERTQLVREALKALVQRESARRLAALGGSEPQLEAIPRRLAY
jgi:Arc/MetJ family transcription regulator